MCGGREACGGPFPCGPQPCLYSSTSGRHHGGPDETGCFGARDGTGSVRSGEFDTVTGVGGIGPEAEANELAGEVNWIGVGPPEDVDLDGLEIEQADQVVDGARHRTSLA